MDLFMVDVSAVPAVQAGEEAVLIGRQGRQEVTAADTTSNKVWPGVTFGLELAILVAAAVGAALTAGTLVQVKAGTAQLATRDGAATAWIICTLLTLAAAMLVRHLPAETVARHRIPLLVLLSAALVWAVLGFVRPSLHAGDGLVGEYFTNENWSGPPAFTVVDAEPSTDRMLQRWPSGPPDVFSVRWTGFVTVAKSGLYTFATTSDDGSELDYSERNVRCYENRFTNVYQGISTQPVYGGPVYIFRNALYNVVQEPFKMHNSPSGVLIFLNTIVKKGAPAP